MNMQSSIVDNRLSFTFDSKLDTSTCRQFERDLLARISEWEGPITFNLQGVAFISSAFLRLVLEAIRRVGREGFVITNVEPSIKLVLKTADLDQLIADAG